MRVALLRLMVWLCFVVPCVSALAEDAIGEKQLARIERAIAAGTAYLVEQQEADGTWRSKTYGLLKDGTSLTPLAAWALATEDAGRAACNRSVLWMSNWFIREDRHTRLVGELQYPIYAAGLCLPIWKRSLVEEAPAQVVAWTDRIRALQLNEENGWSPDDARYGGWGYSCKPPQKPEPGAPLSPLDEPNLSATVFALEGLLAGDREGRSIRAARQAAVVFVSRCQNLRQPESAQKLQSSSGDTKFNDGGFHFMLDDPVRNKPGAAGIDGRGETRFVSYGSATADGLRALLLCGIERTEPRVIAARRWLLAHFEDGAHPGSYPSDRSSLKPSLDYYYAASVARALQAAPVPDDEPLGRGEWARRLSRLLISRQRDDGSWSNAAVDVREDDTLVATPLALRSLQICRDELRISP